MGKGGEVRKIMRARKPWMCADCKRDIKIGDKYIFGAHREPRYIEDVMGNCVQVGIEYVKYHLCLRTDCYTYITFGEE